VRSVSECVGIILGALDAMNASEVDWQSGNRAGILQAGFSEADIEKILKNFDRTNETVAHEEHDDLYITRGLTKSGKKIEIVWFAVCGNPLIAAPLEAFLV
jgi:hypothetical protein